MSHSHRVTRSRLDKALYKLANGTLKLVQLGVAI
jgi:hypothetical protein